MGKKSVVPTMIRVGGRYIDLAHPSHKVVEWEYIVHSLSGINRWLHHTKPAITVLQHSLNVFARAKELTEDRVVQKAALIHDAHEAITGDCPSPVKRLVPEFCEFEDGWQRAVFRAASVPRRLMFSSIVKRADLEVLAAEAMLGFDIDEEELAEWRLPYPPCKLQYFHYHKQDELKKLFLKLIKRL